MILDTQECRRLAAVLGQLRKTMVLPTPALQSRHGQIQKQLAALEEFFIRLAAMAEQTESSIQTRIDPINPGSGMRLEGDANISLSRLAAGKSIQAQGLVGYTQWGKSQNWTAGPAQAGVALAVLEGSLRGSASFGVISGKTLSPRLDLEAQAYARIAGASGQIRVGNDIMAISARAIGEAGAVYGQASCVLAVDEQVLAARVGAAALRGECSAAFELAGVMVTVTTSGSIGGIEAGVGYENRAGKWSVDANGALFVGGGVRIEVDY